MTDFKTELTSLLNRYSAESVSGTPDYILAGFLQGVLKEYNEAVSLRAEWRGETCGDDSLTFVLTEKHAPRRRASVDTEAANEA